jgi:adenosylcobinamide kinase/adenosylcobinamide-phosphate guanylyltransferase
MSPLDREILLVTGACRSGKSKWARRWAEDKGVFRVFVATAVAGDEEMEARIRAHKKERGAGWRTVEEPLRVPEAVEREGPHADVVVVDCLTLWLSNLLLEGMEDSEILGRVSRLAEVLQGISASAAVVTNEVGWGIVPENPLGRRFRDLAGGANQIMARTAHRVVLMVAGIPVPIKGGSVEQVP